ncbi:DNA-methyltransferase [Winogradskyella ouciana]|uniref:Methyltransferase n=1 Tax=Winogradskyella ouciana TaxID=2608631 RepID=A0A7K1GF31_9FLAO|nr:site-specific DNA-methyltransferase [Winogradskyella ouciana]MTE27018.1 site-specific DNA-methyltransferase [Winogradskyella ouciana]
MLLEEYKYIHGDSGKELKKLDNNKFKLIITSPPYNIGKEYESKSSIEEYLNQQKKIIKLLVDKLHPNGSICWQVGNYIHEKEVFPLDIFYYKIFKEFGLKLRNRIIWHFRHGLHSSSRFSGRYETILWFTKSDDYTFNLDNVRIPSRYPGKKHFKGPKKGKYSGNPKGKNPSDIWDIVQNDWEKEIWDIPNVKANHVEKTEHPCQYPIELVERCVLALTSPGDWVLDPFAGVGSTMLSALKNERKALGIEKFKKYIKEGQKRIDALENDNLKVRPINKPIYDHTKSKLSKQPESFNEIITKK